jgi:hypothetical protein
MAALAITPGPQVTEVTQGLWQGRVHNLGLAAITGTGFSGATAVDVDGIPASFTVNNPASITITIPAATPYNTRVPVTVHTLLGTSVLNPGSYLTRVASFGG